MKKTRITFILLIAVLTLAIMPTSVFALEGAGVADDPFVISSAADLVLVKNDLEAHYQLGVNISLSSEWSAIGDEKNHFKGVFDGNGFTISGLNVTVSKSDAAAGLFACNEGTIKNLSVKTGTGIDVTANESAYVGVICGNNIGGTIDSCHVEGDITVSASTRENTSNVYVGMIAGKSTGKISNTNATGSVSVTATALAGNKTSADPVRIYAGGLVGLSTAAQEYNFAVVNVTATATSDTAYCAPEVKAGGAIGENTGDVIDTYAAGNVTASSTSAQAQASAYSGGLIGKNTGEITYTNASGNVTAMTNATSAKTYAGGLIGYSTGDINDSFATGTADASSTTAMDTVYAGGLVALQGGLISNCYAVGEATVDVAATNAVSGGLVGYTVVAAVNSFYKNTGSYIQLAGCGTAKSESEMKQAASYTGWDFDNVWKISENINSGYPYLSDISNIDVTFADATFIYDGTPKSITATDIGDGVTIEYKNNTATDAGVYNAVALVSAPGYATTVKTAKLIIEKKELKVSGIKAHDKEFDNTTAAEVDASEAVLEGVIEGDDVSIDAKNTVANFATQYVGENIEVTVSGIKLTGEDADNYVAGSCVTTANILDGSFDNVVFEGSGTIDDPYVIYHEDELSAIRGNLKAHFRLDNNIELTGEWIPIGRIAQPFEGSFDGNGYTISGVSVPEEINYTYSGLFGYNAGTISNLNVVTESDVYTTADTTYIGAIAGHNSGTIANCSASGNISTNPVSTYVYVGGIAGYNAGTIKYSDSSVNISAEGSTVYAGGVVGENAYSVEATSSTGTVNITDSLFAYAGGFAGNSTGIIKNSYARGNVTISISDTGFMANAGGFAGRIEGGNIQNSYSTGAPVVSTDDAAHLLTGLTGGFTAYNSGAVTGCYYDSTLSGMTDTDKGTPKTTAELKAQDAYTGWDFATWKITESKNDGYPHIKKLYTMTQNAKIDYDSATGRITVDAYTDIENAYLVVASYTNYNGGALIDIYPIEDVTIREDEVYTATVKEGFMTTPGGSVKVMLWENLTTIRPLCSAKHVYIR
ncbi:MAG: hypothetical protein IKT39_00755 [Clostridia bacterium]|nr:hypothetical protein [Clostridia bacterium]